jgi:hypothetical protein
MTDYRQLKAFELDGKRLGVNYKESLSVTTGVTCHTYEFEGDGNRDLAIVEVAPDCMTPLQRVLKGDKTIEGYVSGKGSLTISSPTGRKKIYVAEDPNSNFSVQVAVGELMQWESAPDSKLIFFEICYPPYEDGRFENIS